MLVCPFDIEEAVIWRAQGLDVIMCLLTLRHRFGCKCFVLQATPQESMSS